MAKVIIIGAGGVGNVVAHKCAQNDEVFPEFCIASRTQSKCEAMVARIKKNVPQSKSVITTAQVDADDVAALVELFNTYKPEMVINVALPYQDLPIMDACLEAGVHYLDTANYEPKDLAKFEYSWQWAYREKFEKAGLMALLGSGFDPGVTNVYTAYMNKHHFDEIHEMDIVDCNGGDHGKAFATNFNPEINIREITQNGRYWKGEWIETQPLEIHQPIDYPEVGPRESYVLFHEELESLVKNFPTLKQARFWMTFGQAYINHLTVLQNVGMTSIAPIDLGNGVNISPLEFLKKVLPEPGELGENYTGLTAIGVQLKGIKDGKEKIHFVWNNCDHAECYREVEGQAVGYTTGVPAMIGAMMMLTGKWKKPGVWNMEEFDPDPFMDALNKWGLPWKEQADIRLV